MKNLGDMMKQVQAMQSKMADMQAKLETATVTGQSGGGLVKVTLTGKGAMSALHVDSSLMKEDEKESAADCREKRGAAIDRARKHGGENHDEDGIENCLLSQ